MIYLGFFCWFLILEEVPRLVLFFFPLLIFLLAVGIFFYVIIFVFCWPDWETIAEAWWQAGAQWNVLWFMFWSRSGILDHLLSFVSFCQFEVILCIDLISIMEPIGGPSFFFFFFITIIKDVLFILLYRTSYWYEAIL